MIVEKWEGCFHICFNLKSIIMRKAIQQKAYTIILEPYRIRCRSRILISCPKDLKLLNHLVKLEGISFDSNYQLLTMSHAPMQIRRLLRHLKGFGFWIDRTAPTAGIEYHIPRPRLRESISESKTTK